MNRDPIQEQGGINLYGFAASNTYRFSSKEYVSNAGIYYFGNRFYSPSLQRWLNRDPLQEAGGMNLYGYVGDDPVNGVDGNGLWPSGSFGSQNVHCNSITRVLNLSPSDNNALINAQKLADENQTAPDSFTHAMRDGTSGQTADQARQKANDYVRGLLNAARQHECKGHHAAAVNNLGLAMHALQDSTSPMHNGFQPWYGQSPAAPSAILHGLGEYFDPGPGSQMDQATKDAYDYFTGAKSIPSNFFNYGADQSAPAHQSSPSYLYGL